ARLATAGDAFLFGLWLAFVRFGVRLTARRTDGFAPVTFCFNSFCTAPAFAASVPRVAPIDSATLVRMVSSLEALLLSTADPLSEASIASAQVRADDR